MNDSDAATIYREATALPVARATSSGRGRDMNRAPRTIVQRPILPEVALEIIPSNVVVLDEVRARDGWLDATTSSLDHHP